MKKFLVVEHKNRSRTIDKIINQEKKKMEILEELELAERKAIVMLHGASDDKSKLCGHIKRYSEVKAFLSEEIRVMVLQGCGDILVAMKEGVDLEIDNYIRLAIICHVVMKW